MSVTIEDIHDNPGYDDFVGWLNNEIQNPTGGIHTNIVDYILNKIQVADYYCFLGEIYLDKNTYWGVIFVDEARRVLVIHNKEVVFGNIVEAQVETLYNMGQTGLDEFYSGRIALFTKSGSSTPNQLEIVGTKEFGDDVYYQNIIENNAPIYSGRISGQEIEAQVLGSYNVKIDRLPYEVIEMIGKRDEYTQFPVRVAENVVEHFSYEYIGQVLYVQRTDISEVEVRRLEREGVISSNL